MISNINSLVNGDFKNNRPIRKRNHMGKKEENKQAGITYIYRPYRRNPKTGAIMWARDYGRKAWKIPVLDKRAFRNN